MVNTSGSSFADGSSSLNEEQKNLWSKSNPTSPLKLTSKNSSFNFKKIPDLKKRKTVPNSEENMPKSSAKVSSENDQEDNESIIITKKQLEKFKNKKTLILKRESKNNLVSLGSEASLKSLNDLHDGFLNLESDHFTLEGDIDGLMSVSEPSTRVHTTHLSQHHTEPSEESEDEAVIHDFYDKKDEERVEGKSMPGAEVDNKKEREGCVNAKLIHTEEDRQNQFVENQNETDTNEIHDIDNGDSDERNEYEDTNPRDSKANVSNNVSYENNLPTPGIDKTEEKENEDEENISTGRDISDESEAENSEEGSHYTLTENSEKETPQNESEKELVLEDDLHVSEAEDETSEPAPDVSHDHMTEESQGGSDQSKADSRKSDGGQKIIDNENIPIVGESRQRLALNNFDSTIDKIVANVTTKSVINNGKESDIMDFSAFNWKPNVDFFNFGNGQSKTKLEKEKDIFNFGKGTPPPPQIIKKKGGLTGERPRSKSLQRALAKRTGYT